MTFRCRVLACGAAMSLALALPVAYNLGSDPVPRLASSPEPQGRPKALDTYTVTRPVRESRTKVTDYTVTRPIYQSRSETVAYTQMTLVREQREKRDPETGERVTYTVARHVPEQREKTINYTVCEMVREQKQKTIEYETVCFENIEVPRR